MSSKPSGPEKPASWVVDLHGERTLHVAVGIFFIWAAVQIILKVATAWNDYFIRRLERRDEICDCLKPRRYHISRLTGVAGPEEKFGEKKPVEKSDCSSMSSRPKITSNLLLPLLLPMTYHGGTL